MPTEVKQLEVAKLASGIPLHVPLHRLVGKQKGPILGMTATIHGDDILPIEIIRESLSAIDPLLLCGSVYAIPVANPLGFATLSRNTPADSINLNRVFPGNSSGWLSERLAHLISTEFIAKLDYLVDFLGGGIRGISDWGVIFREKAFALAFGLANYQYVDSPPKGTSLGTAYKLGVKAATTIELGGSDISKNTFVQKGVRGILNVLKHTGMLKGTLELPKEQCIFTRKAVLRLGTGEILRSTVTTADIGHILPQGKILGEVISPLDFRLLETIRAPFRRNLLVHVPSAIGVFQAAEFAYQVGDMDGAEVIHPLCATSL